MKVALFFSILILLTSCSTNRSVYWCGDHACINKKEKEAYFKKTMIVEKRIINKKDKKDLTASQEIIKKAKAKEKKRIATEKLMEKESKLKEKRLKKKRKEQAKIAKLEEKKLKKEEKNLAKKIKNKENKNEKKILSAKKTKILKNEETASFSLSLKNVEFEQIKDRIIKKNLIRSYPNINDIPN